MTSLNVLIGICLLTLTCLAQASDLVKKPSQGSVQETMDRLESIVTSKGLTIFNRIDHQANAAGAGMEMSSAQVLIFGNPKMGTAIMKQDAGAGLDLPLRVLVYQDAEGQTWISYHDPAGLRDQHQLEGNPAVDKAAEAIGKLTDGALR
ncbi:MAG: DUF302 domain-containing protein [Gammaproteobacteria bacterium]|nr:DUF302 domain-containing protein [Gammaproteobacteria bacterium]